MDKRCWWISGLRGRSAPPGKVVLTNSATAPVHQQGGHLPEHAASEDRGPDLGGTKRQLERHSADCECVQGNDMRALAVDDDQRPSVDDSKHSRVMVTKDMI